MDLSRDEAVLMLAGLACSSDGQCDPEEEAIVRQRLAPHLGRLGSAGQERTFTRLYGLMGSRGPEWTLDVIKDAIADPRDRREAVELAIEIVRSDGSVTREEMEHVADVAIALGMNEKELRKALHA